MKTARRSSLEGALIGRVLTLVRGDRSISIPARELPELIALLQDLAPGLAELSQELPTPFEIPTSGLPAIEAPAIAAAPVSKAVPTKRPPSRARRGRVWEGVKRALAANKNAPIPFGKLLDMVTSEALTDRNAEHALKIALGKKVRTGELLQKGNTYWLAGETSRPAAKRTAAAAQAPAAPPRRKHRPGELWKQMRAFLAANPAGVTREVLVAEAGNGNWTPATDPSHAVKICLTRVGDQVTEADGLVYLTEAMATAPATSTVRKRKKARAEETPAPVSLVPDAEPAKATSDEPLDENDPNFDASAHYPTPRSRLPR